MFQIKQLPKVVLLVFNNMFFTMSLMWVGKTYENESQQDEKNLFQVIKMRQI
jgi:hypothetical protein